MYDPSIWDIELSMARCDYIIAILKNAGKAIHLDMLARTLDKLVHEYHRDLNTKNFHNSRYRRILTADIDFINRSNSYHVVIISNNNGVKIATKAECEKLLAAERKEAIKKLAKCSTIARKYSLNGQLTITEDEILTFAEVS